MSFPYDEESGCLHISLSSEERHHFVYDIYIAPGSKSPTHPSKIFHSGRYDDDSSSDNVIFHFQHLRLNPSSSISQIHQRNTFCCFFSVSIRCNSPNISHLTIVSQVILKLGKVQNAKIVCQTIPWDIFGRGIVWYTVSKEYFYTLHSSRYFLKFYEPECAAISQIIRWFLITIMKIVYMLDIGSRFDARATVSTDRLSLGGVCILTSAAKLK